MLEQVPIVECPEAEILELLVTLRPDGVVELARIVADASLEPIMNQAQAVTERDRLRKRMDPLISNFFVDGRGQQARRQFGVLWFLDDQRGGGLDGELVELLRGRAIVEAADGSSSHAQRVHG